MARRQHGRSTEGELVASATAGGGDAEQGLGNIVRRLRAEKRLPLRVVAEKAGVSESFLSQVERGIADPSIASLRRIADALGEPVAAFFTQATTPGALVRVADRRKMVHPRSAWEDALLTPAGARRLQIGYFTLHSDDQELYTHAGDEECIIGQSGQLHVQVDTEHYVLEPGDALLLDPSLPHGMWAGEGRTAAGLWVVTPAVY